MTLFPVCSSYRHSIDLRFEQCDYQIIYVRAREIIIDKTARCLCETAIIIYYGNGTYGLVIESRIVAHRARRQKQQDVCFYYIQNLCCVCVSIILISNDSKCRWSIVKINSKCLGCFLECRIDAISCSFNEFLE